jgi:hypothetical protein
MLNDVRKICDSALSGKSSLDNVAILLKRKNVSVQRESDTVYSYVLNKIRFFLKLYDSLCRDTEMYIPDLFWV